MRGRVDLRIGSVRFDSIRFGIDEGGWQIPSSMANNLLR